MGQVLIQLVMDAQGEVSLEYLGDLVRLLPPEKIVKLLCAVRPPQYRFSLIERHPTTEPHPANRRSTDTRRADWHGNVQVTEPELVATDGGSGVRGIVGGGRGIVGRRIGWERVIVGRRGGGMTGSSVDQQQRGMLVHAALLPGHQLSFLQHSRSFSWRCSDVEEGRPSH